MKLLALETSSRIGSVALANGEHVHVREIAEPREQTEQILVHVEGLLREAGLALSALDGIVFGRGPGSFTGLRVSAAVAQGLSAASGVPLVGVSSLVCRAERAWRELGASRCLVCVDAHMGEVYFARTERQAGIVAVVGEERLGPPADVTAPDGDWVGLGSGFAAHAEALAGIAGLAKDIVPAFEPRAADLLPGGIRALAAGEQLAPALALPVYLREKTAWRRSS